MYQTCNLTSTRSAFPFRPHEQRASRRPAFRAQPLPQEIDGELIRARDSGRRGDDGDHDGRRLHEGKGYSQELTQPDTCPLRSGPRAKVARAPSYIHDDTSRTRYGPRTVFTSTTEPF